MKTNSTIYRYLTQWRLTVILIFIATLLFLLTSCETTEPSFGDISFAQPQGAESIILMEGDTLKINFPGTPTLDTVQPIRRDGKIALPLVGEVVAAGKTPAQLEKQLIELYTPQLVASKQVTVIVQSSLFPVFVTGAILRPGKVLSDHPITALEAIMESGGFDYSKANLKRVSVLRNQNGGTKHYIVNLKGVMNGAGNDAFYLKPYDIIFVPEKFSWF